jgi:D-alanyl-lipoteichoic acid acyltransferase DltB (MBOAT superfamily)
LTRFINGVLKTVFLAPVMQGVQAYCMIAHLPMIGSVAGSGLEAANALTSPLGFWLAALSYLVFLYLNFSGYTDLVIGLGNLLGFRLPENFDRPFTATNFLDFWKHWHMSLSFWFRDYCFTPILKYFVKAGVKNPAIATLPAFFISFALLGVWHGRTWPFILCGLMLAAGATLNHCYRWALTEISAEGRNRLTQNRLYGAFTSALTFLYISIAIAGLWLSGPELGGLWRSFSPLQAGLSFGLITIGLGILFYCVRRLLQINAFEQAVVGSIREFFEGESSFLIAFKMFMFLVWFFSLSTNLPDLVYQEF